MFDPILDGGYRADTEIDVFYANAIHPLYACYCLHPQVVGQVPSFSDIMGWEVEYGELAGPAAPPTKRRWQRWLEKLQPQFDQVRGLSRRTSHLRETPKRVVDAFTDMNGTAYRCNSDTQAPQALD
jgi:hypothetical protein